VSQRARWRRFVERRRPELRDAYPCAAITFRRYCPKHRIAIGRITSICKPCRDELYERLATEYVNNREEIVMSNTPASPAEAEHPHVSVFPGSKPVPFLSQLELFDADGRAREYEGETKAKEAIDDAA
jgi:hypothetical protein